MLLQVFVCSTRPGRAGNHVARWFMERAREHGGFELELVDLAEVNLPVFDEPRHPVLGQYEHAHTKAWSARVDRADAFVLVTPEYNFGMAPALLNALDYLVKEWAYKPAGFVSYGGVSGGLRGVQMAKLALTALKIMPLPDAVAIPFFKQHLDAQTGAFDPGERQVKAAAGMLDELVRWAGALRTLRPGS